MNSASNVPCRARHVTEAAFEEWILRPVTDTFTDERVRPLLSPTGFTATVKLMVLAVAGNEHILPLWAHPTPSPDDPELWAYWIWNQTVQQGPTRQRRYAMRRWALNLSVRCSLHTALMHIWKYVATPGVRQALGLELHPCEAQLTYVISDFDEGIPWDTLCDPEVRLTSAPVVQHESTVSELSSSLIASTSSSTAIYQESIQTFSYNKDVKDFTFPLLEARSAAEDRSKDDPAWASSDAPSTCGVRHQPRHRRATTTGGLPPLPHPSFSMLVAQPGREYPPT